MFNGFKSIAKATPVGTPNGAPVMTPVVPPRAPKSRSKYRWVVVYRNGETYEIETARGPRDARLQAMWMYRELHGDWPKLPALEVQKHPRNGNGFIYRRYTNGV